MLSYISINHSIIIYQNNYGTTIEKLNDTKGVFRSRAYNTMANRKGTRAQKHCSAKHSTEN